MIDSENRFSNSRFEDPPRILTFWLYTSMLAFSLTKFGAQLNEKSPKKASNWIK